MYHVLHRHCTPRHPPSALICFFRVFTCDTEKTILSYVCSCLAYYIIAYSVVKLPSFPGDLRPPVADHLRTLADDHQLTDALFPFQSADQTKKKPRRTRGACLKDDSVSRSVCLSAVLFCRPVQIALSQRLLCICCASACRVAYALPTTPSRATFT